MIPINGLLIFVLAAVVLVITPGPNMIYMVSRSISQGPWAGIISLAGVISGFVFHILMISLGLTAILFAIPIAFTVLKFLGAACLLYIAWQSVKPQSRDIFSRPETGAAPESPGKLFTMGILTNILNPKTAIFYLSFLPQFINPARGPVLIQCLELGLIHIIISFTLNTTIILMAARIGSWFSRNPKWVKVQKWFMASLLAALAVKMAVSKIR